jgi:UDP-N-acetylglucosamine diphosphorylase/glucosamine-1-phosphate N-acetyltransferase
MIKQAIILAAGQGKRLQPFTETVPKVMLPVANKPILEHVITAVRQSGINQLILIVGYKKEAIMEYLKDTNKEIKITYVEQDKQLGTAHALLQAKKHVKGPCIVLSGDNIIDHTSIQNLISTQSDIALLIKKHSQPSKYGVVSIEKNHLTSIIEKPDEGIGQYISTGIYKLPKTIFQTIEDLNQQGTHDLTSVLQYLLTQGKTIQTITANQWMDIIYPWDLIPVNEALTSQTGATKAGIIEKGVTIKGPVSIGKDTTISTGSYIIGPAIIGEGCEIGPHACIFPSTTIGNNTVIHPFCEIRNSVIMNDIHINTNSYISNSIIAKGTTIGTHFSTQIGKNIIEIEGEIKKFDHIGTIIGEDTTIENHVITEPGIIIGRRCTIAPQTRIIKTIPSGTIVM